MAQLNDLLVIGESNLLGKVQILDKLYAHGGISLDESTLEQTSTLPYILGRKEFTDGGDIVWQRATTAVSNHAPTLAWGTTSTIGTIFGQPITVKMPANPDSDKNDKVTQRKSTTPNWRPVLLHHTDTASTAFGTDLADVTNIIYHTGKLMVQPSTGSIKLAGDLLYDNPTDTEEATKYISISGADASSAKIGTLTIKKAATTLYDLFIASNGSAISKNTDINTIKTVGIRYSAENAVTQSLTMGTDANGKAIKVPQIGSGFRLITLSGYSSTNTYSHQWIMGSGDFLWRTMGSSNGAPKDYWYTWIKQKYGEASGSATQPIYINASGTPVACTAYSALLTGVSWSNRTLSVIVGGTTKTAAIPATLTGFTSLSSSAIYGEAIYANSNTAAENRGLIVTRTGNVSESVRVGVNDSEAQFIYTNDEASSSFKFQMVNTDTESNSGKNANTATVTFAGASGKSTVTADKFVGALQGNATSATTATTATTATNATQLGGVAAAKYVTTNTTQSISGAKTFTADTIMSGLAVNKTTVSTNKSSGALQVKGGVGVAGQMSANTVMVGDEVTLQYDSGLKAIKFVF